METRDPVMSVPGATRAALTTPRLALGVLASVVFYPAMSWWMARGDQPQDGWWFAVFGLVLTGTLVYRAVRAERGRLRQPWGVPVVVAGAMLVLYLLVNAIEPVFTLAFMLASAGGSGVIWAVVGWVDNRRLRSEASV